MKNVRCKYCKALVQSYTGRRPKSYCSEEHRIKYHNLYKNKQKYYTRKTDRVYVKHGPLDKFIRLNPTIDDLAETVEKYNDLIKLLYTKKDKMPLPVKKVLNRVNKLYRVGKNDLSKPPTPKVEENPEIKEIKARIAQLEHEIANPVFTNFITKKIYLNVREKELKELKEKIIRKKL